MRLAIANCVTAAASHAGLPLKSASCTTAACFGAPAACQLSAIPRLVIRKLAAHAGYNLGTILYAHACALQEALLASQEQAEAAQLAAAASGSGRAGSQPLSSPTAGARGGKQQLASERAIQSTFAHAAQ